MLYYNLWNHKNKYGLKLTKKSKMSVISRGKRLTVLAMTNRTTMKESSTLDNKSICWHDRSSVKKSIKIVPQNENEFYRQILTKDMNISFVKLGHEECEKCVSNLHKPRHTKLLLKIFLNVIYEVNTLKKPNYPGKLTKKTYV